MRSTELPPGALSVSKSKNLLFLFGMLVAGAYSGGWRKFVKKIFVCVDVLAKIVLNNMDIILAVIVKGNLLGKYTSV